MILETMAVKPLKGRVTLPIINVLSIFLENPEKKYFGSEISKSTKLPSGTVYPLLGRLTANHWLEAEFEDVDPNKGKQPRRLYKLTKEGHNEASKLLNDNLASPIADSFFSKYA